MRGERKNQIASEKPIFIETSKRRWVKKGGNPAEKKVKNLKKKKVRRKLQETDLIRSRR